MKQQSPYTTTTELALSSPQATTTEACALVLGACALQQKRPWQEAHTLQ